MRLEEQGRKKNSPIPATDHHPPTAAMQFTIANQSFEIIPLTAEEQTTYRAYCVLLARRADRPLLRFVREQCHGMTREERQDVLAALPYMPGWSDPPEEMVLQWAKHPKAVAALARRVLRPEKSGAEWEAIIGPDAEAVYTSLVTALNTLTHPSDEDIKRSNQALREALEHSKAGRNIEGPMSNAEKAEAETKCDDRLV